MSLGDTCRESAPQEGGLAWGLGRSCHMALWGPAPACAHLGTAAGDPLMPGGQAPHRVWVRRCRLPAVGWGDGGHAGASGCSGGPSACPYPTRAGAALTLAAGPGVHVQTHSGGSCSQVSGQAGCRGRARPPAKHQLPWPLPHAFRRQDVPGRTEGPGGGHAAAAPAGQRPAAPRSVGTGG